MKCFTKLIIMLAIVMTIVFSSAAIANATTLYPKQIGCTDTTITIDPGNFSTDVTYYEIYDTTNERYLAQNIPVTTKPITIENLEPGYKGTMTVKAYEPGKSYATDSTPGYGSLYINTNPIPISKDDLSIAGYESDRVYTKINRPYNASGGQVEIYNVATGELVATNEFTSSSAKMDITTNVAYKYRVRSTFYNATFNKTYYSEWSDYRYFDNLTVKKLRSGSYNGCKIKLKGVKNVEKYKIYVSKKSNSGYKLTKTVRPELGKTVTYTVNKIGSYKMKKGVYYNVKVVPVISGNHNSDITYKLGFFN